MSTKAAEAQARYRARHPELCKEKDRQYKRENVDKLRLARAVYRAKNKEKINKYMEDNKDKYKAYGDKWREKNRVEVNARAKVYAKANRGKRAFWTMKAKAAKMRATPLWANTEIMELVYLEAAYRKLVVDHVIPLRGKIVCGLHVYANTQLLTKSQNSRKCNSYVPQLIL